MLRLLITGKEAELYQNEPVNLKYQFTDVSDINASTSNFSQTFRLPMTEANQSIFGSVQELSVVTPFDIKQKLSAALYNDGILLMSGYVQVKGFYKQKGRFMDVECVFFGEVSDLSKKVGDGMMTDLDLSDFDSTLNTSNIEATWNATSAATRFGIVDRGSNWSGSTTWNASDYMDASVPTGFLRASDLLTKIFTEAGLTYESNFFGAAPMTELYLMANAGALFNGFTNAQQNVPFHVGLNANAVYTGHIWQDVPLAETGSFFDAGGNWSSATFTAPADGNYTFRAKVSFFSVSATDAIHVALWKNGSLWQTIVDSGTLSSNLYATNQITTPSTYLETGDVITYRIFFNNSSDSCILRGTGDLYSPSTSLELIDVTLAGTAWNAALNMPTMKQIDFLFGLQRMFNLVFIPDHYVEGKYHIEPFADYISSGVKKDWSNKINLDKDVHTTPTTDLQARSYEWNMTAGQDFIGQQVLSQLDRVYGRFRVTDPNNDFATGTKDIQSPFASYTISNVPNTDFQILRMIGPQGEVLEDPLPRLAFWTGLQTLGNWYFGSGANQRSTFPHFSDLSDFGASVDPSTIDLNFGYERKFRPILANPRDALYYKYWHPFTGELYSSDARIMTAFFRLTASDINQFEWSDQIYIQDAYWRILSIEYTANDDGALAKVTLLKRVAADRLCSHLPLSFDKDGRIKWVNESGTELYSVPQACCDLFGGRYDQNTSFCWGQTQLT